MAKVIFIFLFAICYPFALIADVPKFDIIQFKIGTTIYYMRYFSEMKLHNNDLCYYNYKDDYVKEVRDFVDHILSNKDWYKIYKTLVIIEKKKLKVYDGDENVLYVLKDEINLDPQYIKSNYLLLQAFVGNYGGTIFTEDLTNNDNIWIRNNSIEKLFTFNDLEICTMALFAIKGSVSKEGIKQIKARIENALRNSKEAFQKELKLLYQQQIVMIGNCSC